MIETNTVLTDELRLGHAKNEALGCGNFLHAARAVSPFAGEKHFWMDKPCRTFQGESFDSFSLNELCRVVDTYASWYCGAGVRPKDVVGVYVGEGIENLIHYLAINALGAIPAIVNGNMPAALAAGWLEKVGATGLYSDPEHHEALEPHLARYFSGPAPLRFQVTDKTAGRHFSPRLPAVYPYQHGDNDPVLIGHSSGTTGIPKAVEFRHQQFFYGIRYRLGLPFAKGSERMLSALPHSHSAGIAYLMLSVLSGCQTMILSSNRPEVVLPNIERFRPTMVVAFPETYVYLNDNDLGAYDLTSIQLWFNGGDAAHEAHIRKLIENGHHFENGVKMPGSVFIDGLGSSEMGFSLFRNIHTPSTNRYDRCIGQPLEWVEAAVLGENGEKLPPYRVGKLGVKSPSVTPGYWNDSALTARSKLSGYFLTGDLFYYDEQGRYFHVDRVPDVVRTDSGVVYSLQTEEYLLKHFPELSDCTVTAMMSDEGRESAGAMIRLKRGTKATAEDLLVRFNTKLTENGMKRLGKVLFTELTDVPLGPTGKVLKRELRERLQKKEVPHGRTVQA